MKYRKTIVSNVLWLFFTEVLVHIMGLLFFAYIARILGTESVGKYTFLMSVTPAFFMLTDFGLSTYFYRKWVNDLTSFKEEYSLLILFKIFVGLIASILCLLYAFLAARQMILLFVLCILLFFIGCFIDTNNQYFMSQNMAKAKMKNVTLERLIGILLGLIFLSIYRDISSLLIAYIISRSVSLLYQYKQGRFCFAVSILRIETLPVLYRLLQKSLPLFLSVVFFNMYYKVDNIVLKQFSTFEHIGYYNVAFNIIILLNVAPMIFMSSLFPSLRKIYTQNNPDFNMLFKRTLRYISILSLGIVFGVWVLGERFIVLFFSEEFLGSAKVLKILILSNLFIFFNTQYMNILMVQHKEQKIVLISLITLLINVILDIVLVQHFSIYGVAIGTLFCEVFMLMGYVTVTRISPSLFISLLKSLISGLIMIFFIRLFFAWNFFVLVTLGVFIYGFLQIILKNIKVDELV